MSNKIHKLNATNHFFGPKEVFDNSTSEEVSYVEPDKINVVVIDFRKKMRQSPQREPQLDKFIIKIEFKTPPSPTELEKVEALTRSLGVTFTIASIPTAPPAELTTPLEVPKLPNGEPALWAKRTSGREVSPVDFIRKHYGDVCENGSWIPKKGLTRDILSCLDSALLSSYDKAVLRHPDRALPGLKPEERVRVTDPMQNLERRKQLARNRQARYNS